MTKREMFTTIMTLTDATQEIREFCEREIALLDKKVASSSASRAKKTAESEPLKAEIYEALVKVDKPIKATDLQKLTTLTELSPQKFTSLLCSLVKDGKATTSKEKKVTYYSAVV